MDALNWLHLSVSKTFENCFDTAYKDAIAELAAYDGRVKDALERAKTAEEARQKTEAEADTLRLELALLREQRRQEEIRDKESERAIENALQLDEKYEPRHVLETEDGSESDAVRLKRTSDRYVELYEQACIVIQASGALRGQVKRHRGKVTFLRAELENRAPVTLPSGKNVKSKQQTKHLRSTTGPLSPPGSSHTAENPLRDSGRSLKPNLQATEAAFPISEETREQSDSNARPGRNGAREIGVQEERPELTSTPSNASTEELPSVTSAAPDGQAPTLKRKRVAPGPSLPNVGSTSANSGNGGPIRPVMIKSETLSSSPLQYSSPQPGPTATQDLDDVGDTVVTPTKRIRFYRDQSFSAPPDNRPTAIDRLSGQHGGLPDQKQFRNHGQARALQPINSNVRTSRAAGQMPDKRRSIGAISKISLITEDGDENRPRNLGRRTRTDTPQGNQSLRDPASGHRLSGLLEGTSPGGRMLQPRATDASTPTRNRTPRTSVTGNATTNRSHSHPTRDKVPATPEPSLWANNIDRYSHQPEETDHVQAMPDHEPYRARPLQRLGLEHFKINPDFNNGVDYAYNEVIRRKDERKCASGCTRPGCCGDKFRAMARFGMPVDAFGKEVTDDAILQEYLGEDKNAIGILSREDRENLLVEAKARAFSNRYGKHRHQHHRAGTPPGFWRTDMPGTQEIEDDHGEARRLEREKVEERYREAVRPGGRWTFADE